MREIAAIGDGSSLEESVRRHSYDFLLRIMSHTLMAGCDSSRCLENVRLQKVLKSHTVQLNGRLKRTLMPPPPETGGKKRMREKSGRSSSS